MNKLLFFKLFVFTAVLLAAAPVLACDYSGNHDYSGNYNEDCFYVECNCDEDCGTSTFTGVPFCKGGDVYRNYRTATCLNPGTEDSECSISTSERLWYECESWQTCGDGVCVEEYSNINVQTNSATSIANSQATLNGYLGNNSNANCNTDVWFEYGPTLSYGYQTNSQIRNYSGSFSQNVNLYGGYGTYHFRAVAQDCRSNTVFGQDRIFYINTSQGTLDVSKTVKNLTSASGWASTTYANPLDVLLFMITLRAPTDQSVSNALVRDYLPNNLIYKDQLIVSGANYSGDISSGISLNNIQTGKTVTITYQAQVAGAQNFSYGTTTLRNSASVTNSGSQYAPAASASIIVTRAAVYGATTIPTGLTNNFWFDSFVLPLGAALVIIWLWRSGMFFGAEKWLAKRTLNNKIASIQKSDS